MIITYKEFFFSRWMILTQKLFINLTMTDEYFLIAGMETFGISIMEEGGYMVIWKLHRTMVQTTDASKNIVLLC